MDSRGNIHQLEQLADVSEMERRRRELESRVGKLVPIPEAEIETVKAMPVEQRVAWYRDRTTAKEHKAARKAQRAARKKQRRAR